MSIQENIIYLQDQILAGKISEIKFTVGESYNADNNMPVVDYVLLDENGEHLASDCAFETLDETLSYLVKDLRERLTP